MTALKPSIQIGHGSGDPAGMPGFRPMNPWGRSMPKLTRPMPHEREGKPPHMQLFQIWADDAHFGKRMPLGPKMPKEVLEAPLYALNKLIIEGMEKRWSNASLEPATAVLA